MPAVRCSGWILIIASQGWERAYPKSCWIRSRLLSVVELSEECVLLNHDAGFSPPHPREVMMRFYTRQHSAYCGVDLHARSMYLCILDAAGTTLLHHNYPASPEAFLAAIAPCRADLVVGCECMFAWYWLADLCQREGIPFVL